MFSGNVRKIATLVTAKDEATDSLRDAEDAGDATAESMGDMEESSDAASSALDRLDVSAFAASAAVTALGAGMQQMFDATSQMRGEAALADGALQDIDRSVASMAVEISDATFATNEAVAAIRTFGQLGAETEEEVMRLAVASDTLGDAIGESSEAVSRNMIPAMTMFGDDIEDLPANMDMFAFAMETTTMNSDDFNAAISAGASDLQEMDASTTEATGALVALQQQTNLTGGRLRREFQQRLRDADGDLDELAASLNMTREELAAFEDDIPEDFAQDQADAYAETKTVMDELRVVASDLQLRFGQLLQPLSVLPPVFMAAGGAGMFYASGMTSAIIPSTVSATAVTAASTAALRAKAVALSMASRAQWLMTASTGTLIAATWAKVTSMAASATAMGSSAIAAMSLTSVLGVLAGAKAAAAAGAIALWTALGPIGLLALALTGIILGLVAVWQTDFLGAGEAAGGVLGWFGDQIDRARSGVSTFIDILHQLGRIFLMVVALFTLGPIVAFLRFFQDPQRWANAGANAGRSLLDSLAGFLSPGRWVSMGSDAASGLISGLVDGIVPEPVSEAVSGVAGAARDMLPFSDAATGPLSDLSQTGPALVETLGSGIQDSGGIAGALGGAAGGVMDALGGSGDDSGGGGGTAINIEQNIVFENAGDSDDVRQRMSEATEEGALEALERKLKTDMGAN